MNAVVGYEREEDEERKRETFDLMQRTMESRGRVMEKMCRQKT